MRSVTVGDLNCCCSYVEFVEPWHRMSSYIYTSRISAFPRRTPAPAMESLQVEGVISSWSTAEAGSERRESGGGVNGDDMIIDKDKVERVGDDERGQDVNGAEDKINENGEVGTRTTGEDSNGLLTGETPVAAPPPHLGGGDALKDTGGSDEIPALPSDAMDEDKVDGSDKKDTLAGSLDDLAPLPTEFDPDAPLSPIENADPADEEDELAIVPREEEKQEVAAEEAMDVDEEAAAEGDEGDLSARQDGTPADEEDAPEAEAEDGHEPSDQPDSNLLDILRGLQNKEEEEEEGAGEDNEAEPQRPASPSRECSSVNELTPAFNSPLTPLPELPDELPPDSELPPPAAAPPAEQWAESSAQAAARSSAGILGLSISREDRKRRGEAPVRYGTFTEEDELASSSDADDKRQKYKRKRGLDGKPIRCRWSPRAWLIVASKQPRKRLDAQLGITRHGDKPPDKVAPREWVGILH